MSTLCVELLETRVSLPRVIGKNRHGDDHWSSIDRQAVVEPQLYLTWTGLAGDQPTETRPKTEAEGGDGQIHGGNDKAVYVYPVEHYPLWLAELGHENMGGRSLGENWRTNGLTEADVRIGDIWEIGAARLKVSRVRTPCQTLMIYYGGQQMIKRMVANGLCGWYLQVLRPGLVPTHGWINIVEQNLAGLTVAEKFATKMRTPART